MHPPPTPAAAATPPCTHPTWDCRALNSPWILGSGAEPSSTNWPPRSRVRKHECLIRWVPAGGAPGSAGQLRFEMQAQAKLVCFQTARSLQFTMSAVKAK